MRQPLIALAFAIGATGLWASTAISHTPMTGLTPDLVLQPSIDQIDSTLKETVKAAQLKDGDIAERGRAIAELQTATDADVDQVLQALHDDGNESMLIRTWAAAARVNRTTDLDGLMALAHLPGQYPAVSRPYQMRAEVLAGDIKDAEGALFAISRYPQLRTTLASVVVEAPGDSLLRALLHSEDQQVRYQAASFYAAKAQQVGHDTAGTTYANAISYRSASKEVPWAGGALYVPGIQWPKAEARDTMRALVAWQIWAYENGQETERQQAVNNLQSVGLIRAAGWSGSFYGTNEQIMQAFAGVAGKNELESILKKQGLAKNPRYSAFLGRI